MYLSGPRAFDEMAHASLVLDSVSLTTALAGNATFSCQGNLPALTGSGLVFRFDLLQNPQTPAPASQSTHSNPAERPGARRRGGAISGTAVESSWRTTRGR
jgi:hypothetical protein